MIGEKAAEERVKDDELAHSVIPAFEIAIAAVVSGCSFCLCLHYMA
jgi:hypothetical protein